MAQDALADLKERLPLYVEELWERRFLQAYITYGDVETAASQTGVLALLGHKLLKERRAREWLAREVRRKVARLGLEDQDKIDFAARLVLLGEKAEEAHRFDEARKCYKDACELLGFIASKPGMIVPIGVSFNIGESSTKSKEKRPELERLPQSIAEAKALPGRGDAPGRVQRGRMQAEERKVHDSA